jgi:hypothetical protein
VSHGALSTWYVLRAKLPSESTAMSFVFGARLRTFAPVCTRLYSEAVIVNSRSIPPPRGKLISYFIANVTANCVHIAGIDTPEAFLKAIGREADTKITFDNWDDMFNADREKLKGAGLEVRDRRCVPVFFSCALH